MDDCVFCAIVEGRAPASVVYRDAEAVAFFDLFPVQRGHLLVVPRVHVVDLASSPPHLAAHLMSVAQSLARPLVGVVQADGFNIWTANGRAAGQEIFHLHFHVLPRFEGDEFGLRFPKSYPRQATREELDLLAQRLGAAL